MISLIIQIILSLTAALIGIVQLFKEFRKHEKTIRKEAKILSAAVILYACLTIFLSLLDFLDNRHQQNLLQTSFSKIYIKNDLLEKQIVSDNIVLKKTIDTSTLRVISNSAEKALAASKELRITADKIRNDITGTAQPPLLNISISDKLLSMVLINKADIPAFCSVKIENYSEIEKCSLSSNKKIIDQTCFKSNTEEFLNQSLIPNIQTVFPTPNAPTISEIMNYKLLIFLYIKKQTFVYQVYFYRSNNIYNAKVRILKKIGKGLVFYSEEQKNDKKINWNNEFNLQFVGTSDFYNLY